LKTILESENQFLLIFKNLYFVQSLHRGHGRKSEDIDFTQHNSVGGKFKLLEFKDKHQK
jgi:hypothetical protein